MAGPRKLDQGRTPAARAAIWGATLGSGLPTRNPYAGMWLGVLMLALASDARHGVLLGGLFGGVHGLSRALATLASIQRPAANAHPLVLVAGQMRWRLVDGTALLATAGILISQILTL